MATKSITVTVCDWCESTEDVKTHLVAVDRWRREVDVCASCWAELAETLNGIKQVGRRAAS